ncbi:MAG TPA: pyroglutamyl-peptidase I [Candidatus Agrococcus pullicola]|uniref:Pyroglutamyl-peptidase I n=1 Tax=Candidatus Agrococcus pullicola TaxID=2838429 RepID=A0A9D2CAV3_9MICO|nr:pyroglutamyl-peptidase I [Candidatus Agrococcus pullicola]
MRILVTGFEAFGDDTENASITSVNMLDGRWSDDSVQLVTGALPVAFGTAGTVLHELVARYRPDAVIAVGEAGGRTSVTPESRAVNDMDARIPDNAGLQPRAQEIFEGGQKFRESTLDVEAIADAVRGAGVASDVSDDAGRFVCNYIAYLVAGLEVPGTFIHVPAVRSEGAASTGAETDPGATPATSELGFEDLAKALEAAVHETVQQLQSGSLAATA